MSRPSLNLSVPRLRILNYVEKGEREANVRKDQTIHTEADDRSIVVWYT